MAAKSGFTAIALQPNSFPSIDNQSQVNFVLNKAQGFATQLYPIGALTKESAGRDMAELYDMKKAGAVAFGDYNKSLDNANLLKMPYNTFRILMDYSLLFHKTKILKETEWRMKALFLPDWD